MLSQSLRHAERFAASQSQAAEATVEQPVLPAAAYRKVCSPLPAAEAQHAQHAQREVFNLLKQLLWSAFKCLSDGSVT